MTPFQSVVQRLILEWEQRHGRKLSGRELSARIGKSRNHLSQIMNDGLVPSGEALLRLADALEADAETRRELVAAGLRAKLDGRARDTFWLEQALDWTEDLSSRVDALESFLAERGMLEDWRRWRSARRDEETGGAEG